MTDGSASQDAVMIERTFDAPADLIWQMWTESEHFKAWYGPDGVTVPVAKDLGGRTKLVLTHVGIPADSPGSAGWTMALSKLAARAEAQSTR